MEPHNLVIVFDGISDFRTREQQAAHWGGGGGLCENDVHMRIVSDIWKRARDENNSRKCLEQIDIMCDFLSARIRKDSE